MPIQKRSLIAIVVCAATAIVGTRVLAATASDSSFELVCGAHGSYTPGTVVVQLLDRGHGHLSVAAKRDTNQRYIEVVSSVAGRELTCAAIADGHFQVRATAARLNRSTLRISADKAVPVEVRDLTGAVVSKGLADPASGKSATLTW